MKKFLITGSVLFGISVISLYLASYFHFYGPSMWYRGAIPESWSITTKLSLIYFALIVAYIYLSLSIRGKLLKFLTSMFGLLLMIPWFIYALISVVDFTGDGGKFVFVSWLMAGISMASFLAVIGYGWIKMFKKSKV